MYTLKDFMPSFGQPADKNAKIENTLPLGTAKDPEATLATVLMTRLHDPRMQNRFHRLLLMDQNDTVLSTHPLNRKIVRVGRSRYNHVQIKDPLVSVRHLSVSVSGATCVVNDFDSSNGTFINGERLTGSQVLNDGDEIMLGKTVLRFAARQESAPKKQEQGRRKILFKKQLYLPAVAVLCLAIAAAIIFHGTPLAPSLLSARTIPPAEQVHDLSQPSAPESATAPSLPIEAGGMSDLPRHQPQPMQTPYVQQALADYSAGRIDSAVQTLNMLAAAREQTSEAFQAKQILAMFGTVRQLHSRALLAQEHKKFAAAIECWDRLLTVDMELVGDRPSFFAAQAEQRVKALSYDYALDALRSKNNEKARQLCRVILQIDPNNQEALALLAKIDPKA